MKKTKRGIKRSKDFKRSLKSAKKSGKNIALLWTIIENLANDIPLAPSYRDHELGGNLRGHRECHITPDWLLVYRKTDKNQLILHLISLGSHSSLGF
ncbi:MAG: type II toxin-antitoxin system YafQ family toxin [Defluviitaleaceae bacterium]|nr:type II toxin-antitoxin system YafQ family toxin [Defluviitaleaceae bacterium]